MGDYTKVINFTVKDSLNSTVLGSEIDSELVLVQNASTTKAGKVGGTPTDKLAKLTGTGDLADSGLDASKTPQVDDTVQFEKDAVFTLVDSGSGGSKTINWSNGNKHKCTMSSNGTLTFTAPGGPCNLLLKVYNSGGSRSITWPSSVKWPDSTQPTESASGKYDIYSFFYDGTNYWGGASLNY